MGLLVLLKFFFFLKSHSLQWNNWVFFLTLWEPILVCWIEYSCMMILSEGGGMGGGCKSDRWWMNKNCYLNLWKFRSFNMFNGMDSAPIHWEVNKILFLNPFVYQDNLFIEYNDLIMQHFKLVKQMRRIFKMCRTCA